MNIGLIFVSFVNKRVLVLIFKSLILKRDESVSKFLGRSKFFKVNFYAYKVFFYTVESRKPKRHSDFILHIQGMCYPKNMLLFMIFISDEEHIKNPNIIALLS